MSAVKAIFPSISIKRKPKGPSPGSTQLSQSASASSLRQIFRPLTPESTRKLGAASSIEPIKGFSAQCADTTPPLRRNASDGNIKNLGIRATTQTSFEAKPPVIAKSPRPQVYRPGLVHRESATSFHDRSSSVNSETSYYSDLIEAPMIDQEDIIALTHHVRAFSEALGALRNTFFECSENPDDGPPEVKAHERLGEVLSILKGVLNKYQPLHSTDILAAAGTLISKVKSHNYDESSAAPDEFCESIDQLALAFSSSVSDFLMGDQDMPLCGSREHSRSLDDFGDEDEDDGLVEEDEREFTGEELDDEQEYGDDKEDRKDPERREVVDKSAQKADELDRSLIALEHGVDLTLQRCKIWSKYAKDIASYLERRAHLELEFTNKLSKLAQTTRAAITEERYLPFQSIFVTALDQDIDYADTCAKTYGSLLSTKFVEPLQVRRNRHEQTRKELKDTWTKSYKKLNEAIVKLEKGRQTYIQKQQELEKFKLQLDLKDGQELSTSYSRTQKKKQDDLRKADEAEEWYNQCVSEATVRQRELEKTKSHVLLELRQLIYQCDMTMKAVTCNYFHMMNTLSAPIPVRFQILAESSRAYEPGTQFADFVKEQMATSQPTIDRVFTFESYQPYQTTSSDRLHSPMRHNSAIDTRNLHSPTEETSRTSPFSSRRHKSLQMSGQLSNSSNPSIKAWTLRDHLSDAESNGSKSAPGSPSYSPSSRTRSKTETHSALNMESSDEDSANESDDKEHTTRNTPRKRDDKNRPGSGPFRDCRMSGAAQTHKFKKLRSPSKCRDCDSYVYFNGAECSVCGLTCHRKCLARLTNKCGNKGNGVGNHTFDYNPTRRMTTFGVDFHRHLLATDKQGECVPYIVSSCIEEINSRGLHVKGIYRVSGVKSKVEKLCQAFENVKGVDLSEVPPHVIAAVLKLYLRQLPEPLLTFNLYQEFINIAKESFNVISSKTAASEDESIRAEYDDIVRKLRRVVVKLPKANFKTAAKVIEHLNLVALNEDDNHMPASNLGIVFGPTLLQPRETASSDSVNMSALVDMQHQTRTIELLITNRQVFDPPDKDDPAAQETPVEEFSVPDRDRSDTAQSLGIRSVRGKDTKAQPVEPVLSTEDWSSRLNIPAAPSPMRKSSSPATLDSTDISTPDAPHDFSSENLSKPEKPVTENRVNKLGSQSTRPQPSSPTSTSSARAPAKVSLGFGTEFFELLAKSNERPPVEGEKNRIYTMPEFLLPGSTEEREPGDESDIEDMDESSTTQGTSGSRTPEDDLGSSHGSLGRDASQVSHSEDSLDEKNYSLSRDPDPVDSPPLDPNPSAQSMPEISNSSRSSSIYSTTTVSFGSDLRDDELLPDLSEYETERNPSAAFEFSERAASPRNEQRRLPKTSVDDTAISSRTRMRPHNLGLFKRNSDLPGMIARGGFFPLGIKKYGSETDANHKSGITGLPGLSRHKQPGISDALREMHSIGIDPSVSESPTHVQPAVGKEKEERQSDGAARIRTSDANDGDRSPNQQTNEQPGNVIAENENRIAQLASTVHLEAQEEKMRASQSSMEEIQLKGEIAEAQAPDNVDASPVQNESKKIGKHEPLKHKKNSDAEKSREKQKRDKDGPPVAEKKKHGERKILSSTELKTAVESTIPMHLEGNDHDADNTAVQEMLPNAGEAVGDNAMGGTSAHAGTYSQEENEAAQPERKEKGSVEDKDRISRQTTRVSVKDRRRQYEQSPDSAEPSRKTQTSVGNFDISSRKQVFESTGRDARRDSYKRLSDLTKKAKSSPGLDGSHVSRGSGSDTGSDSESRKERVTPLAGRDLHDRLEKLDSRSRRKEKSEARDRPRSLILENLRLDKIESLRLDKQNGSEFLERFEGEKNTFSSRKVDIPLDSPETIPELDVAEELRQKPIDKSSARSSGRSPRPHFPEGKSHKERQPQFV